MYRGRGAGSFRISHTQVARRGGWAWGCDRLWGLFVPEPVSRFFQVGTGVLGSDGLDFVVMGAVYVFCDHSGVHSGALCVVRRVVGWIW